MPADRPRRPRVFVDADVLFASAASSSEHGASLVVLRMAEITLIEAVASRQVITEAERNLRAKLPAALPAFGMLVQRCLEVVADPPVETLQAHEGKADAKDLPILIAAASAGCPWLVTTNTRHYLPGHPAITVLAPGQFVQEVRYLLGRL